MYKNNYVEKKNMKIQMYMYMYKYYTDIKFNFIMEKLCILCIFYKSVSFFGKRH